MLLSFRLKQVCHFDTLKAAAAVLYVCALCEMHMTVQLYIYAYAESTVEYRKYAFLLLCGGLNYSRYGLPLSGHTLGRFTYNVLLCAHMENS